MSSGNAWKEDIITILLACYNIPGQYLIGAWILLELWKSMRDLTDWALILPIFAIFFIFIEIITPIMAGKRLWDKLKNSFNRLFKIT